MSSYNWSDCIPSEKSTMGNLIRAKCDVDMEKSNVVSLNLLKSPKSAPSIWEFYMRTDELLLNINPTSTGYSRHKIF